MPPITESHENSNIFTFNRVGHDGNIRQHFACNRRICGLGLSTET